MRAGFAAELDTADAMLAALRELKARGYRELDAFTPYPVKGADEALGLGRSRITLSILPFTLAGAGGAYFLEWWCNAYDYPLNVGGRPLHSAPAFIPIAFEMGVLATALAAVVLMLVFSGLPELHSPLLATDGFERASIDRFWIGIDARDPRFDEERTARDLHEAGALRVVRFGGRR